MEKRVELYAHHIQGQQLQIRYLEQVINTLKSNIGNYDGNVVILALYCYSMEKK